MAIDACAHETVLRDPFVLKRSYTLRGLAKASKSRPLHKGNEEYGRKKDTKQLLSV